MFYKILDFLQNLYIKNLTAGGASENSLKTIHKIFEELKSSKSESISQDIKIEIAKIFKIIAKELSSGVRETDIWNLLKLEDKESFLDVGSNNMRTLNEVAYKFPNIKKITGVDLKPFDKNKIKYPDKIDYVQTDFSKSLPEKLAKHKFDVINFKFSLHHFETINSIEEAIKNTKKLLTPNGRLILWEESYEDSSLDIKNLVEKNKALGIDSDYDLTTEFYNFSASEKQKVLRLNDEFINAKNSEMPWKTNYLSWEEWLNLIEKLGFKTDFTLNLGVRINKKITQGFHIIGEFRLN